MLIEYQYEDIHTAPDEIKHWVDLFKHVQIATARTFGDRTYLLMTSQPICPQEVNIRFSEVLQKEDIVLVTASFNCTEKSHLPVLASIPATSLPIQFELQYWWVSTFSNSHNLTDVPLPGNSSGVLVSPAPDAKLGEAVQVSGFACCLFEAEVNIRLVELDGRVAAETFTSVAGGFVGPDWGSFEVLLDLQDATPGEYWLELGIYRMSDGGWILFDRVRVRKE